jgi:hypothetical protein
MESAMIEAMVDGGDSRVYLNIEARDDGLHFYARHPNQPMHMIIASYDEKSLRHVLRTVQEFIRQQP